MPLLARSVSSASEARYVVRQLATYAQLLPTPHGQTTPTYNVPRILSLGCRSQQRLYNNPLSSNPCQPSSDCSTRPTQHIPRNPVACQAPHHHALHSLGRRQADCQAHCAEGFKQNPRCRRCQTLHRPPRSPQPMDLHRLAGRCGPSQ
jgi:hypothetical protein